jgi:flagellar FliL protein
MADENEEIENEDAEGEEGEGKKKKPGLIKLALFIGLPVLILVLGGVAAMLLLSGGGDEEHQVADAGEHGEQAAGHGGGHGASGGQNLDDLHIVALTPMQISISDGNGGFAILQMNISFETADEHLGEALVHGEDMTTEGSRLVDQYVGFLRELRPEDLAGSAGLQRIRMELLRRAQLVLGEDRVQGVLITNFLIA